MGGDRKKRQFSSQWGFVLSAVGSAVGMANVWGFPAKMGSYGGGAFLIAYLVFIILFGTVGLSAEYAVGRRARTGTLGAYGMAWSTRKKSMGKAGTIDGGGSTRLAKAGGFFAYNMIVNQEKTNSVRCQFAKEDNGKTIKISVGDSVIAEKTLNYTGEEAFCTETFEIPADVLEKGIKTIQVDGKDYTVVVLKFESASATEDRRLTYERI